MAVTPLARVVVNPPAVVVNPPVVVNNPVIPAPKTVLLWSDAATWGGGKPVAGATVLIPSNMKIVLDENTPALGDLNIEGELSFQAGATAEISAATIRIQRNGALRAGSATAPFTGKATITLTSQDNAASAVATSMGTRGILVTSGGKLELFGAAPAVPCSR